MSGSFLALALVAIVLMLNWRLVLLVLTASLIALVALGMGVASGVEPPAVGQPTQVEQPAPADQPVPPAVIDPQQPH